MSPGTSRATAGYHYVYVLVSQAEPSRHYTGCTEDLEQRIKDHSRGHVPHTAKFAPSLKLPDAEKGWRAGVA